MPDQNGVLSDDAIKAIAPTENQLDAVASVLRLALWLTSAEPKMIDALPVGSIVHAQTVLESTASWLISWHKIVEFADSRIRLTRPNNIIPLKRIDRSDSNRS